jgi:hypothetical protein
MHAQLILQNNKIFIKDCKSKFGTLILIQNSYPICEKSLCLQIGRTFLECSLIGRKEYERLKKEQANTVNEKGSNKTRPLFRILKLII